MRKRTVFGITMLLLVSSMSLMPVVKAEIYYWDNVRFVEGYEGGWIKYPHPDRVFYGISPYNTQGVNGYQLQHLQFDEVTSVTVIQSADLLCALIGGYFGGVAGIVAGAALGVIITFVSEEFFFDEYHCIWVWISLAFASWLYANQYALLLKSITDPTGTIILILTMLLATYLRVGVITFVDAMGVGNPDPILKNPCFEKRANPLEGEQGGVFRCPPWESNNGGWRNVRGDIDDDGDCDSFDLFKFREAYVEEYNWKADFDGDGDVDSYDLYIFRQSYIIDIPCRMDGIYSWYTNGGGDYQMWQWLDFESVQAIGGKQATFSFWFYPTSVAPNGSQNYARAESSMCSIMVKRTMLLVRRSIQTRQHGSLPLLLLISHPVLISIMLKLSFMDHLTSRLG